jgi:hypothetical protein
MLKLNSTKRINNLLAFFIIDLGVIPIEMSNQEIETQLQLKIKKL